MIEVKHFSCETEEVSDELFAAAQELAEKACLEEDYACLPKTGMYVCSGEIPDGATVVALGETFEEARYNMLRGFAKDNRDLIEVMCELGMLEMPKERAH